MTKMLTESEISGILQTEKSIKFLYIMKKILIALAIILLSLGALLFSMKCLDWTLMKAIGFAGMVMCLAMTVWTHYTWGWIETNKHCFSYWFAFRDMDKWPNAKGWKWGGFASMVLFGVFMFIFLCHVQMLWFWWIVVFIVWFEVLFFMILRTFFY